MPSPPRSASGPRIQNVTASPVEITSVMTSPPREAVRRRTSLLHLLPDRLVGQVLLGQRWALDVVVLLVVAEAHRVRRLLHARQQRGEQLLLRVDQVEAVVVGHLV